MNKDVFSNSIKAAEMLLLLIVILIAVSGCGNSAPELNQIYSQVNFIMTPKSREITVELLVLVNADDEDGYDNIESVKVINNKDQQLWEMNSDIWSLRNNRGMKWIGSQHLLLPDKSLPEPGEYAVIVEDKAGDSDEGSFFIPMIKEFPADTIFPEIIINDDKEGFIVNSSENRNILSFYDKEGKLLAAFTVTAGKVNISKLKDAGNIKAKWNNVVIAMYSNQIGAGLTSGPYYKE